MTKPNTYKLYSRERRDTTVHLQYGKVINKYLMVVCQKTVTRATSLENVYQTHQKE